MRTGSVGIEARIGEELTSRIQALLGSRISPSALGRYFDCLAVLLHSGISLPEALVRAGHAASPELHRIGLATAQSIRRGVPLFVALEPYRRRLPDLVIPVLQVGEVSGTMEGACVRLASSFNGSTALERKFRYAIYDPRMVIAVLAFEGVALHPGRTVTASAEIFVTLFLTLGIWYLIGRALWRVVSRWRWLRLQIDAVCPALPHVGSVLRDLAAARWGRSFITLWNAGVPVSRSLEISARSALNAHYERILLRAAEETRHGRSLSGSLEGAPMLPRHLVNMIAAGEASGKLAEALSSAVGYLEDEAFNRASEEFMVIVSVINVLTIVAVVTGGLFL